MVVSSGMPLLVILVVDTVYAGSNNYLLYALDKATGGIKWSFNTGGQIGVAPVIDNQGVIYIGSDSKMFYALNPDGIVKWQYELNDIIRSSPAIGPDGTIYVASYDGHLYAFGE
jgi:outer membrane protein assembly factor BamB